MLRKERLEVAAVLCRKVTLGVGEGEADIFLLDGKADLCST